jgi:hypothetical protein
MAEGLLEGHAMVGREGSPSGARNLNPGVGS